MTAQKKLPVYSLDSVDFTQYGQAIRFPDEKERKPDLKSNAINFFGGLGIIDLKGEIEFGICTFKKREFIIEQLEQHKHTQELLYAVDDDFIIPVAPNTVHGSINVPDLENLTAVRIRRGEGAIFQKGVWHWAPYPFKKESWALVGFAKDTALNDLEIYSLSSKIQMKQR